MVTQNRIHVGKGYGVHSEDDPQVAEALTEYKRRYLLHI